MIRLGLIGYPLAHSLSPALHQAALDAFDLPGEYLLYPVAPDDPVSLAGLLDRVRSGVLRGLNVTIPYKQAIIPFLDALNPVARVTGAVNTIYRKDGILWGDNTDAPAFLSDLGRFLAKPQYAIVLGAGGAARSVVHGLQDWRCSISLVARRTEQARSLTEQFGNIQVIALTPETLRKTDVDLIVNTTPVGMFPDVDRSPWPASLPFPDEACVYDLIYNPRETLLARRARAAGLKAITGLGMLIEQAGLAFELWTGREVQRSLLWDAAQQLVQ